jgi:hypothetical protein
VVGKKTKQPEYHQQARKTNSKGPGHENDDGSRDSEPWQPHDLR